MWASVNDDGSCHDACHTSSFEDMIVIMIKDLLALLQDIRGQELEFPAGQFVFQTGDPVRRIHTVRSGSVFLVRHQRDGAALVLQRATAGSILAEASLYSEHYHCSAEAQKPARTWTVSRREIRRRLAEDQDFSHAWCSHLAAEVQRARLHAEIVSLRTVAARLNAWMAWNGPLLEKGEWSGIAQQIGVSPEALYRELARRR